MNGCILSRRHFLKLAGLGLGLGLLAPELAAAALKAGIPEKSLPYRVGPWLPSDQAFLEQWMQARLKEIDAKPGALHPAVLEFKELIENDPVVYMLVSNMFAEVPKRPPFTLTPAKAPQIRDYKRMLLFLNLILTTAPEFSESGLVGFPINAMLDWPMGTKSGQALFLNGKVNAQLKKILNEWGRFLASPESAYVLNEDPETGWFGAKARKAMPGLLTDFEGDPAKEHHGFASWDAFFTRKFREGRRPVAAPDDPSVVANACESAPYRIATNVQRMDRFWIKSQPYSLWHMLGGDPATEAFAGGTAYQAFLSALSYHRWHSPVDGRIVRTKVLDGSYYAAAAPAGFDPASPNESQGYITDVATRALVLIEADNPAIGLMAFLAVGMAEVSTCEVTVKEGQRVKKGEELGMFHFGGSTHCLIFRPQTRLTFDLHGQKPGLTSHNIPVNARLATVRA